MASGLSARAPQSLLVEKQDILTLEVLIRILTPKVLIGNTFLRLNF